MVIERILRSFAGIAYIATAGVPARGPLHREPTGQLLFAFGPLSALEKHSHEE